MKAFCSLLAGIALSLTVMADPIVINNTRGPAYVAIPDIRLSLVPPSGFAFLPASDAFTKNGEPVSTAQYVVQAAKINLDYTLVRDSIVKNVPAGGIQDYIINHYTGVMTKRTVAAGAVNINLYTLAFGNGFYTYVVNAYCPAGDAATSVLLPQAILSAYVDTLGAPSPVMVRAKRGGKVMAQGNALAAAPPALGFSLDLSGTAFKIASVIGPLFVFYTQDGVYPALIADKSFLRIYSMKASVTPAGQADFSKAMLNSYSEFTGSAGIQISPTTVATDGLSGYEVTCTATDAGGQAIQVYQKTLFDGDTVYLLTGVYYPAAGSGLMPVFKTIYSSFKRLR
ncbi:MAG TPA: hypothetical protein VMH27_04900 [Puia sp.]|nr:hypothetical protein [Puia sp.]